VVIHYKLRGHDLDDIIECLTKNAIDCDKMMLPYTFRTRLSTEVQIVIGEQNAYRVVEIKWPRGSTLI